MRLAASNRLSLDDSRNGGCNTTLQSISGCLYTRRLILSVATTSTTRFHLFYITARFDILTGSLVQVIGASSTVSIFDQWYYINEIYSAILDLLCQQSMQKMIIIRSPLVGLFGWMSVFDSQDH